MEKILSQDEVDSLLEGIEEGKVETETDAPATEEQVKRYDFEKLMGPGHLRMPGLKIIHERLASYIRISLGDVTRSYVGANLESIETMKFKEFGQQLLMPSSLNIFRIEPLKGYSLIVFDGGLVFSIIDTSFGGKGQRHVKLEGRGFTNIELKIINKVCRIVLKDLERAWADFKDVQMVLERSEMDPQFASVVAPNEVVVVIRLKIDLQNESGTMIICLPFSTIEPIKEILQSRYNIKDLATGLGWRTYLQKELMEITVGLSCSLGTALISGRRLMGLKPGETILLDQRAEDPVKLFVEGIPKFLGFPGEINHKKAIRIKDCLSEE